MSITLYTTAWGDYWNKHGNAWTENVKTLNPQPDRIIIISDKPIESEFEVILTDVPDKAIMSHFRNVAVENTNTEWIVPLDLDDRAYVDFLANLNYQVEVHAFGYLSTKGHKHFADQYVWNKMLDGNAYSYTIPSTSAIKLETIKKCGGYPKIEYEDAGFWCNARKNNVLVHFDQTIRFLYNEKGPSLSRSGRKNKEKELISYFQTVKM